ncbi:MAG TPA: pyridoxamine 5'-phosphate oxidase [Chitinophagales bacterium]|nr:pyridoxamine 5'-phosphate oxidase [Chitinophagales bacterium]
MDNHTLQQLRRNYASQSLDERNVLPDPLQQFNRWFDEAMAAEIPEPNAMTLATAMVDYKPSARVVLLKGITRGGFVFFTNYMSRKGKELTWNPYASLLFFWPQLERQVRVEGRVEKISREESDAYFKTRPRGSQLGAWVSRQSSVIENRAALENALMETTQRFENKDVELPEYWGGYVVLPQRVEFWQGRPDRLHDRLQYTFEDRQWLIERLAP